MSLSSTSNMNNIKERHRDGCKSLDFWMHKEKKTLFFNVKISVFAVYLLFLKFKINFIEHLSHLTTPQSALHTKGK